MEHDSDEGLNPRITQKKKLIIIDFAFIYIKKISLKIFPAMLFFSGCFVGFPVVDGQDQLAACLAPQQRVAVLGNSHSAAVALAKLGATRPGLGKFLFGDFNVSFFTQKEQRKI